MVFVLVYLQIAFYTKKLKKLKAKRIDNKSQRRNLIVPELEKSLSIVYKENVGNYFKLENMRIRKDDETISYEKYKQIIALLMS